MTGTSVTSKTKLITHSLFPAEMHEVCRGTS